MFESLEEKTFRNGTPMVVSGKLDNYYDNNSKKYALNFRPFLFPF